jgi:hypothetical protein
MGGNGPPLRVGTPQGAIYAVLQRQNEESCLNNEHWTGLGEMRAKERRRRLKLGSSSEKPEEAQNETTRLSVDARARIGGRRKWIARRAKDIHHCHA